MFRFGDLFISLIIVVGATVGAVTYLSPGSERAGQPLAEDMMEVPDEPAGLEPEIDESGMTDFASDVADEADEMTDELMDEAVDEGADVAVDSDSMEAADSDAAMEGVDAADENMEAAEEEVESTEVDSVDTAESIEEVVEDAVDEAIDEAAEGVEDAVEDAAGDDTTGEAMDAEDAVTK